jgi:hypothetical protein
VDLGLLERSAGTPPELDLLAKLLSEWSFGEADKRPAEGWSTLPAFIFQLFMALIQNISITAVDYPAFFVAAGPKRVGEAVVPV